MKYSFPVQPEGLTEWKAEIGNCVQDLLRRGSLSEMQWSGKVLNGI
ncbi:hypothetical protein [Flagellimonas maritima]|nr:hypothetical protein [Allomuricauda aurantiaca]